MDVFSPEQLRQRGAAMRWVTQQLNRHFTASSLTHRGWEPRNAAGADPRMETLVPQVTGDWLVEVVADRARFMRFVPGTRGLYSGTMYTFRGKDENGEVCPFMQASKVEVEGKQQDYGVAAFTQVPPWMLSVSEVLTGAAYPSFSREPCSIMDDYTAYAKFLAEGAYGGH